MATHKLQDSTIQDIKKITNKNAPAVIAAIEKECSLDYQHREMKRYLDTNDMRAELGNIIADSFVYGLKEDKDLTEVFSHLLSALKSKAIETPHKFLDLFIHPAKLMRDSLRELKGKFQRISFFPIEKETEMEYVGRKIFEWDESPAAMSDLIKFVSI